jgi:hypothetical protein
MSDPEKNTQLVWNGPNYPRADYLSSSRKRLAPQLLYKGGILKQWRKKQAVTLHKSFYATLPDLPEVSPDKADIAWFLYSLEYDSHDNRFHLVKDRIVYTAFEPAMLRITTAPAGPIENFISHLQSKLDNQLSPPEAPTLQDIMRGPDE